MAPVTDAQSPGFWDAVLAVVLGLISTWIAWRVRILRMGVAGHARNVITLSRVSRRQTLHLRAIIRILAAIAPTEKSAEIAEIRAELAEALGELSDGENRE